MRNPHESQAQLLVDLAQSVAKKKTKERLVEILHTNIVLYLTIAKSSMMHYSATDIVELLSELTSEVEKL